MKKKIFTFPSLLLCILTFFLNNSHAQTSMRFGSDFTGSISSYTFASTDKAFSASGNFSTSGSNLCSGALRRTQVSVIILQLVSTSASSITVHGLSSGSSIRNLTSIETSATQGGTYAAVVGSAFVSSINSSSTCGTLAITGLSINSGLFVKITFSGNVNLSGFDVTAISAASAPATQASNIVFSNIAHSTLTTSWTNGNGAKRVVFMKEGVQGTITNPSDGTAYTASADWSSKGTQLGTSGYYCVYDGTAATVDLSSLSGSTTYWFQVFEYNGSGSGTKYLTTTATNNPNSQLTNATPVSYFYKSKQTGNWGDASSWLSSSDDITYIDAVTAPSSSDNAISILNTHEITVNTGSVSVDELTVAVGGKLIVSAGATLSVVNGTGADLTVNGSLTLAGTFASAASSTIAVNGTFENQINAASFSAGSGAMTINAGGTYKINGYSANAVLTFTNVTFTDGIDVAGATLYIASGAPRIPSAQNGNVIWNTPSSGNSIFNSASNSITGSFTIIATVGVNNGSGGSGRSVTVGGNMYMQGGIYHVSGNGAVAANNMTVNGDLVVSGGILYASATTAGGGSGTIFVKGNIDYSGGELGSSSTVTSGTISLTGTTAQAVAINSTNPILIGNLIVNNAAGVTLSGTEFFNVLSTATITSGELATGGRLVLKSTATGTARIAAVAGTLTGNVTTETFIPAGRRAYRFLGNPFTTAQAMSGLIDDIYVTGDGTVAGTGGATPGAGLDATSTNAASSFWFDQTTNGWKAFMTATDASWTQYAGIRVLVRGDRTQPENLTASPSAPNAVTLDMTGAVNTGNQNIALSTAGNYHLVSNPYPSPTDIGTVVDATTNIGTMYWVWDANAVSKGAYVPLTVGSGAYNLAMNGAFFVQPTVGTTLAFTEANKTASATANLYRTATASNQLEVQVNYNGGYADKLFVRNNATASTTKEATDGSKLSNPDVNIYAIASGNDQLTLDSRPIANNTIIPVGFTSTLQSNFEIALNSNTLNNGLDVIVKDKFLNVEHTLTTSNPYIFAVTADAASQGENRFELVFRNSSALPTNFVTVSAVQQGNAIAVNFTTANEQNMSSYEVEESANGNSFTKGTSIKANNTTTANYNWLDATINNGNNYYRIKAIEKNGVVKYSQVVNVRTGTKGSEFAVYPNPVKGGTVNVQLMNVEQGLYSIKIVNKLGQEIASRTITHNGGSATQSINIGNVASGTYNMVISNGTTSVTKTVIVE